MSWHLSFVMWDTWKLWHILQHLQTQCMFSYTINTCCVLVCQASWKSVISSCYVSPFCVHMYLSGYLATVHLHQSSFSSHLTSLQTSQLMELCREIINFHLTHSTSMTHRTLAKVEALAFITSCAALLHSDREQERLGDDEKKHFLYLHQK